MPTELNAESYRRLIDEDLDWLDRQPRTLERDHIRDCLLWLRKNKPASQELFLMLYDDVGDWYFHGVFADDADGLAAIERIISNGAGYRVVRGDEIRRCLPRDDDEPNYSPDPEDFM